MSTLAKVLTGSYTDPEKTRIGFGALLGLRDDKRPEEVVREG